jgi:hypothetical protein
MSALRGPLFVRGLLVAGACLVAPPLAAAVVHSAPHAASGSMFFPALQPGAPPAQQATANAPRLPQRIIIEGPSTPYPRHQVLPRNEAPRATVALDAVDPWEPARQPVAVKKKTSARLDAVNPWEPSKTIAAVDPGSRIIVLDSSNPWAKPAGAFER